MAEPYIGEIRLFGFDFAPAGWAKCDGGLLSIEQNQALFSILGTTYGGDGRTEFGLPGMRGRTPISFDDNHILGEKSGTETIDLTTAQIPTHTHIMQATNADAISDNNGAIPTDHILAQATTKIYSDDLSTLTAMNAIAVGHTGGGTGMNNMQPFLTINFCIALTGTYPPRN
ncbi:MAG: phage tail protein [Symploca sp. SIO1A3]|nr:phage tail protein [Symploca sp. SIO2C1]NER52761.1 phage tail protein [Symploca sp. SIO1A3]